MTTSQTQKVEWLRKEAEKMAKEFHSNGEIKTFKVEEHKYFVSVYIVTGNVSDEGTLASVLAREICHLYIGKRGAVTYPIWNTKRSTLVTKKLGRFQSLWSVSYEQEKNS